MQSSVEMGRDFETRFITWLEREYPTLEIRHNTHIYIKDVGDFECDICAYRPCEAPIHSLLYIIFECKRKKLSPSPDEIIALQWRVENSDAKLGVFVILGPITQRNLKVANKLGICVLRYDIHTDQITILCHEAKFKKAVSL